MSFWSKLFGKEPPKPTNQPAPPPSSMPPPPPKRVEYFDVGGSQKAEGTCSDDDCPCGSPGAVIPRGTGYLVISEAVVEFRREARTLAEGQAKAEAMQSRGIFFAHRGKGVVTPILCCAQSPLLNSINRSVAADDAKQWWKTGKAPLRPTPRA